MTKKQLPDLLSRVEGALFNVWQKIHPTINDDIVSLVRGTGLFVDVDTIQFDSLLKNVSLVKYEKNKIVFKEGDSPDALYIIKKGSVRVFRDTQNKKIALARLNKGDYFGEQAILGLGKKTRNANIETVENTILICISSAAIIPMWQESQKIKNRIKKLGNEQAIEALTATISLYGDIKSLIKKFALEEENIIEVEDKKIIFRAGDPADKVYLVLDGQVDIVFLEGNLVNLSLHNGDIFGELGVIENSPRKATAIAHGFVRLIVINKQIFMAYYEAHPELKNILANLKKVYQIPMEGIVEQYVGDKAELGSTITNIIKLNDGRSFICIHALAQNIFTMSARNPSVSSKTTYKKDATNFVELHIAGQQLTAINTYGDWENLPTACHMMLENIPITDDMLQRFVQTGELLAVEPPMTQDRIICACLSVTESQLENAIKEGINTLEGLSEKTGACTVCTACQFLILGMLGKSNWLIAKMRKLTQHNENIISYSITPSAEIKDFLPGQHIIVQAKINDTWVERAYTISDLKKNNDLRLTIRKEPQGLFTQWLFNEAPDSFEVNITIPQGEFTLDYHSNAPILCFAGGIGITPFICYAQHLATIQSKKIMHLHYTAMKSEDFVFVDDFKKITQSMPSFAVAYHDTIKDGWLKSEQIMAIVNSLPTPEIYICGSEKYVAFINDCLQQANYDFNKIHIEKFVHAGSPPQPAS